VEFSDTHEYQYHHNFWRDLNAILWQIWQISFKIGCFITLSVITNIYNKKTKGPTLMELFTAPEKLKKFFVFVLQLELFDVCTAGDTAHTDTILKLLPHTRQHGCFLLAQTPSFSKLFIPRTNGLVCMRVLCVLCTKCTLHSKHRLTVWYSNTLKTSPPERPFSHYIHSHRLAAEMWTTMKSNLLGKKFWVVPSICTGFLNTCPTVFL